jgi:hypothetical protein
MEVTHENYDKALYRAVEAMQALTDGSDRRPFLVAIANDEGVMLRTAGSIPLYYNLIVEMVNYLPTGVRLQLLTHLNNETVKKVTGHSLEAHLAAMEAEGQTRQ